MAVEERDKAYLSDMLSAARDAGIVAGGLSYDALMADLRTRLALERALEIIGEAARRVSAATRQAHPQIPWKGIIGTRNVLSHEYGAIDYRRLHATSSEGVPRLIEVLERILGTQDRGQST
jgi:uncharacterized protein with HEPN domain